MQTWKARDSEFLSSVLSPDRKLGTSICMRPFGPSKNVFQTRILVVALRRRFLRSFVLGDSRASDFVMCDYDADAPEQASMCVKMKRIEDENQPTHIDHFQFLQLLQLLLKFITIASHAHQHTVSASFSSFIKRRAITDAKPLSPVSSTPLVSSSYPQYCTLPGQALDRLRRSSYSAPAPSAIRCALTIPVLEVPLLG